MKKTKELWLSERTKEIRKLLQIYTSDGHHKISNSRRDLLRAGVIGLSARVVLPSVGALISQKAFGADECEGGAQQMPSFIMLSPEGGAMLAGAVLPRDKGGQQLASYRKLGMGATAKNNTETLMGVDVYSRSRVMEGIKSVAAVSTLQKTQLLHIANTSNNDTSNNNLDCSGLILNAGLRGGLIANAGTGNNLGRARYNPAVLAPPAALAVDKPSDLTSAIGLSGSLKSQLTEAQQKQLIKTVQNMSDKQARSLNSIAATTPALEKLVRCATSKNSSLINNPASGLSITDPALANGDSIRQLYNVATNTQGDFNSGNPVSQNSLATVGSLFHSALLGHVGPVGIEMGGYDYHAPNTRTAANARDFNLGQMIGYALQHAALTNKKLVIQVSTDGGASAPEADNSDSADWSGDAEDCSATWAIFFDPAGVPKLREVANQNPWQIGAYNANQRVDTSFFFAGKPGTLAAVTVAVNYLRFAGFSEAQIVSQIQGSMTSAQMSEVLRIA